MCLSRLTDVQCKHAVQYKMCTVLTEHTLTVTFSYLCKHSRVPVQTAEALSGVLGVGSWKVFCWSHRNCFCAAYHQRNQCREKNLFLTAADKTVYLQAVFLRKRQTSSVCATLGCVYCTREPVLNVWLCVSVDLHQ